ncbi:MAG TPA: hypothetical protein VGH87_09660, partial [Polyangiaceae bacterium]
MTNIDVFEGCDERIELPCAVIHPASKQAAARVLDIDEASLEHVIDGTKAWVPDVGLLEEEAALDRGFEFGDFTNVDGIAARVPELVQRHVPIEKQRLERVRGARVDTVDATYGPYMAIVTLAEQLRRLLELRAPEIIVRHQRTRLQRRFEALVAARS